MVDGGSDDQRLRARWALLKVWPVRDIEALFQVPPHVFSGVAGNTPILMLRLHALYFDSSCR